MHSLARRAGLMVWFTWFLVACTGASDPVGSADDPGPDDPAVFSISGNVGNSSLVVADLTVTDADGTELTATTTDSTSAYAVEIGSQSPTPITVAAQGGVDLIIGTGPRLQLTALAFPKTLQTVNVSPLTTLAARMSACAADNSQQAVDTTWSLIESTIAMGLNSTIDPMQDPLTSNNIAPLVLTNEALREALRRTQIAMASASASLSLDDIMDQLACDLWDGQSVNGTGQGVDPRVIAVLRAAEAAVLLEAIGHQLHIDGQDATTRMDEAIATVMSAPGISVADVTVTSGLVAQARNALSLFLEQIPDDELLNLAILLDGDPTMVAANVAATLDSQHLNTLTDLPERVALADQSEIDTVTSRMSLQQQANAPILSFMSSDTQIANGDSVTLSWASSGADRCEGRDGWTGEVDLDGTLTTAPLTRTTDYVLECIGLGGSTQRAVQVIVTNPDPAPKTILTATATLVEEGNATTLNWSSENATTCTASGGWSGSRSTSGNESTGTLTQSQTYTLTCSGSGGSDTASVTVNVNAAPEPPATVSLSAANTTVAAGDSTDLTWTSSNATSCQASGGWSGAKALSSTETVGPLTAMNTFTLTCTGPGGSDSASVTVAVDAPDAPALSFQAADSQVDPGGSTSLTWSTSNATSCSASDGWSGTKTTNGNETTAPLTADTTFTLTCSGAGGSISSSVVVSVRPTVTISAAPGSVAAGDNTSLSWSSSNATSCRASNGWSGPKSINGNEISAALTVDTTFTLTCTGAGGSASAATTVQVTAPPEPTLTLSAADTTVNGGDSTRLTWSSSNVDSCSASGGGWSGTKTTNGNEISAPLTADTTFTLTCSGAGGSISSSVVVSVRPTVTISAAPSAVTAGDTTSLSWSSSNATSCSASNGWSGTKGINGNEISAPLAADTTFTLTCTGPGGSDSASANVAVDALNPPTLNFQAADSQVDPGGSTSLTWSATNATGCSASGGWSGNKGINGNENVGPLAQAQTFTLTCSGAGGSISSSVVVSVRPTVTISAAPSAVTAGDTTSLSWSSSNATSCSASNGWSGAKSSNGSETTAPLTVDTTFTLTCTGAGGATSAATTVQVTAPPEPTLTLSAADTTVDGGDTTRLTWSSSDADSCSASGGWSGSKGTSGNETTTPLTADTTFTLTCSGAGGSISSSVLVNVNVPPTVTISAAPSSVTAGDTTSLSWSSSNATSCSASNGWSGTKGTSGNETTAALTADTTFTLTCTGAGGSASAATTVQVSAAPEPTLTLSAADTTVNGGDTTTLTWSSSDADSCSASDGWSGSKGINGNETVGPLAQPQTFTLTCSGVGGSSSSSVVVNVRPSVTISAAPGSVAAGDTTSLSWSSSNATSCSASGGWSGTKGTGGNETTAPLTADTTFTLTCTGAGGSASAATTVQVSAAPEPTLTLSAADTTVNGGDTTTLTWSSSDADSCSASGGWSGTRSTSGNETTTPLTADTTFTLTCSGAGGNAVAMIEVSVAGILNVSWVAPTENVDGSTLTDLASYTLYYGEVSGNHPDQVVISDPNATSFSVTLDSGSYYVVMTATDEDGNESAKSNEVLKATQ